MTEEELEKYINLIGKVLFPDAYSFSKVLWRMSSGSRNKAISIAKKVLKHYKFPSNMTDEDFEYMFDMACADVNDGIEVEWLTE